MTTVQVDLLTDQGNNAALRLPDRKYPGVLLQGDSLHYLAGLVRDALAALDIGDGRGDAKDILEEADRLLNDAQGGYEHALKQHGLPLPY